MKTFEIAKKAAFVSLLALLALSSSAQAEKHLLKPALQCGQNQIWGRFVQNDNGNFILRIRHGSSSPVEFIVLGGNVKEKLSRLNTDVRMVVDVKHLIRGNDRSFVHLVRFEPLDFSKTKPEPVLLAPQACSM